MVGARGGNQGFPAVHLEGIVRFCTAGSRADARVPFVWLYRARVIFGVFPGLMSGAGAALSVLEIFLNPQALPVRRKLATGE